MGEGRDGGGRGTALEMTREAVRLKRLVLKSQRAHPHSRPLPHRGGEELLFLLHIRQQRPADRSPAKTRTSGMTLGPRVVRHRAQRRLASPPTPNENPNDRPETMPTLPGANSWANTTMAGKAEARIRPMITVSGPVQNSEAYGASIRVKGRVPRMENQITSREPVADRAADHRAHCHRRQEGEHVQLRRLHRQVDCQAAAAPISSQTGTAPEYWRTSMPRTASAAATLSLVGASPLTATCFHPCRTA